LHFEELFRLNFSALQCICFYQIELALVELFAPNISNSIAKRPWFYRKNHLKLGQEISQLHHRSQIAFPTSELLDFST